jgi:hypothetical protein
MSPLRSPSNIRLALVLACGALGAAGCSSSSDSCGPGGAPTGGAVATGTNVTLTYGSFVGGVNNDCPAAGAPAGVISVTIHATQSDGTGQLTLCVSRPDLLASRSQALGGDASAEVRVVDLAGTTSSGGCGLTVDPTMPVAGTASSSGLCDDGSDPAGFALVLDGTLALTRTCGDVVDSVAVTLRGRVAVAAQ